MAEFGELVTVDPSQAWRHEEHHFTPWLVQQENLDKLSKETGLPLLELVGREVREGSLRADIIARDIDDERVVLIENQLAGPTSTTWGGRWLMPTLSMPTSWSGLPAVSAQTILTPSGG